MIFGLMFAVLLTMQSSPQSHVDHHAISVAISAASDVVKLGSELRINVVVTNIASSKRILRRSSGKAEGEFINTVFVRDDHGNIQTKTKYHHVLKGENTGNGPQDVIRRSMISVPVEPGESVAEQIIVNKLYDLSKPGKYTIQVEHEDPDTKTNVKSNTIIVTITP
jgi:hypothetical protein